MFIISRSLGAKLLPCHCEEGAGATDEAISGYLEITIKLKNIILFQRMLNNSRLIKLDFVPWNQRLLRRATPRNDMSVKWKVKFLYNYLN